VVLSLAFAAPAFAGAVYSWQTEDGTYAFTDDPKRIPARYKDAAVKKTMGKLSNYPYLTPAKKFKGPDYYERLAGRLATLQDRELGQVVAELRAMGGGGPSPASGEQALVGFRTGRRPNMMMAVPTQVGGEVPLTFEQHRVRTPGRNSTKHNSVMRRGNKVVAIREGDETQTISLDPPSGDEWIESFDRAEAVDAQNTRARSLR